MQFHVDLNLIEGGLRRASLDAIIAQPGFEPRASAALFR